MLIKKLIKYIDDSGIKKKKVAKLLEISAGHLSYIISGKRDPSLELERKIINLVQ